MELADVEKLLVDGETIERDGGVVSGPGGAAGCCRVTVTLYVT